MVQNASFLKKAKGLNAGWFASEKKMHLPLQQTVIPQPLLIMAVDDASQQVFLMRQGNGIWIAEFFMSDICFPYFRTFYF